MLENKRETIIRDTRTFIATLSPLEQKVCYALMEFSQRKAAEKIKLSHQEIRTIMEKIKRKMIEAGLEPL